MAYSIMVLFCYCDFGSFLNVNLMNDYFVDKVHDMMDDIAEQQDVAREISEAISNPVAFGQEFDDDELEAELNELEAEGELAEQVKYFSLYLELIYKKI